MATVRWKVEHQHQYPHTGGDGHYYWTSVYYYNNLSTDPTLGPSWNALIEATYGGSTYDNRLVAIRVTNMETGNVHGIATPTDNHGLLPEDGGGSLINVIRFNGFADGRYVSYHMWRPPLRLSDFDGGMLGDTMWEVVNDVLLPKLAEAGLMNKNGEVITRWEADREIHPWQMRHGTIRRTRPVFYY